MYFKICTNTLFFYSLETSMCLFRIKIAGIYNLLTIFLVNFYIIINVKWFIEQFQFL